MNSPIRQKRLPLLISIAASRGMILTGSPRACRVKKPLTVNREVDQPQIAKGFINPDADASLDAGLHEFQRIAGQRW